ncbi:MULTISPECIES: DUF2254 domain-containing protein [unclassified Yoonia]|uniref:DUF2254 domain-containing protein n=1 Tax=unclassified Yoonia TaxID=2629118 RepID=UPI002B0008DD|nr:MULTISPECIES: DUF2254 domain-containing protein [unclassified Yoonia]
MIKLALSKILQVRQNYWFWPSLMTCVAVVVGILMPMLDRHIGAVWLQNLGFVPIADVDGARAVLTTLAASSLGVAGVAFSVTMVAVSFASANYGPRLISNFMANRQNQVVLGVFVATFAYSMVVLSTVNDDTSLPDLTLDTFVPQIAILFALVLTLAAVGALIFYIHHIPESINIMNLLSEIGGKLERAVIAMLAAEQSAERKKPVDLAPVPEGSVAPGSHIAADCAGFLQHVNYKGLVEIAEANDIQVTLHRAPGDFLVPGDMVLSAQPQGRCTDKVIGHMRNCFTIGANRTEHQDILFLSDQLVEVCGRALSPGVNDPMTAILCLNWLKPGLTAFAQRPPARQADPSDPVIYQRMTFKDMLDQSFDGMRQYVATDHSTTLRALEMLADIAVAAGKDDVTADCKRQAQLLAASAVAVQHDPSACAHIARALRDALQRMAG